MIDTLSKDAFCGLTVTERCVSSWLASCCFLVVENEMLLIARFSENLSLSIYSEQVASCVELITIINLYLLILYSNFFSSLLFFETIKKDLFRQKMFSCYWLSPWSVNRGRRWWRREGGEGINKCVFNNKVWTW